MNIKTDVNGSVGIATLNRPEVQIFDAGGLALGLDLQATNLTVRAIAIKLVGVASKTFFSKAKSQRS